MRVALKTFVGLSFILFVFTGIVGAQDVEESSRGITAERMRILILPAKDDTSQEFSIDEEVTGVVANVAVQLGRFEVIDRRNLESILAEQALQQTGLVADSDLVELGKLAASDQAILVDVLNFHQVGVAPAETTNDDDDEDEGGGFWGNLVAGVVEGIFSGEPETDEPYANNIQTQLSVEIRSTDIATGKSEKSFDITVSHTGGGRGVSRAKAIENFREALVTELRLLYALSSEVISVEGDEALLFLGAELGVGKNTLFEIKEPDTYKMIRGRQMTVPGRSAGLVCVSDLSSETNRSLIVRQWRQIEEGDLALEYTRSIHGFQVYVLPPFPEKNFQLGVQFLFQPLAAYDFGFFLRYSDTFDSYDTKTRGFGLGGFGAMRILVASPVQINARLGLDLDIFFKKDDADHSVVAVAFSGTPGLNTSLMLSRTSDIEINLGYRLSGPTGTWTYSADEKTYDAVWDRPAPEINLSGWFFTVGYKYIIF